MTAMTLWINQLTYHFFFQSRFYRFLKEPVTFLVAPHEAGHDGNDLESQEVVQWLSWAGIVHKSVHRIFNFWLIPLIA